ncbi:hypothetical protein AB685_09735 [Bacillus sp. LL01]|uniref:hypothetical protein n=1 Tax=Bacillus sp. LL01 TaxID=1665556 RepID=UPI00064D3260|nr:hypothetical protein [Bacillus sp. LL01]KMJ58188.1 hypothetical protein AB685_09735 [Bacillus sp. LL01]
MSEFDFGEEHLKFLFERWKVHEGLAETDKLAKADITSMDDAFKQMQLLESQMNRDIGNLERWMEGEASSVPWKKIKMLKNCEG